MGNLQASEFANLVEDGSISLILAIEWHLQFNCYPPIRKSLASSGVLAIQAAQDGDTDTVIRLPDGVLFRGREEATAAEILDGLYLWGFVS